MSLSIATVGDLRYALGEHNLAQLRIGERQATYRAPKYSPNIVFVFEFPNSTPFGPDLWKLV